MRTTSCLQTDFHRLILYFPVSALVTLFGNILQNPQDPRARSDVRLMNLVVNFLSMLGTEEENGGVKRMLGVCSEFERIAKVVLDKAEKETSSRRKRKSHENKSDHPNVSTLAPLPQTPVNSNTHTPSMASVFSPPMPNQMNHDFSSPGQMSVNGLGSRASSSPTSWQPEFPEFRNGSDFGMATFADTQGYINANDVNTSLDLNTFQQPFVPQDLWQMPMTLEWDWADMTGGQYPSFENGVSGDPNMNTGNNAHLQHVGMQ